MGKKSKKNRKAATNSYGGIKDAPTQATDSTRSAAQQHQLAIDWELVPPPDESKSMIQKWASPKSLSSKIRSLQSSGTWRVSIRRARLWCERPRASIVAAKKKGIDAKYRAFCFSVMIGLPDYGGPFPERCKVYTFVVEDEEAIENDPRNLPFSGKHFLAALNIVMGHAKSKPNQVVLWPNVSFRISSVLSLIEDLSNQEDGFLLPPIKMLPCHEPESPLSDCNAAVEIHTADETGDSECVLFQKLQVGSDGLVPAVETHLERVESRGGTTASHRSAYIPSPTENVTISRTDLRRLFEVCKMFHEKRPWETIDGERSPLQVTVPDLYRIRRGDLGSADASPTRTYFCVVSGMGSWDARGIHMHTSWNDAVNHVNSRAIMYQRRVWAPYRTLDHIEELDLSLPQNDGRDGDESYPWIFFCKHLPQGEEFLDLGKISPDPKEVPSLLLVVAAVTLYVDRFCTRHDDNSLSTRAFPVQMSLTDCLPVDDNELLRLACSTTATVAHCRNFSSMAYAGGDFDSDKYMETMSVGSKKICNFCQKPKRILKEELGERLLTCSKCKSIHYCSKRCQTNDWTRHRPECRLFRKKYSEDEIEEKK